MDGGVSRKDKMSLMRNHKLQLMQEKLRREQIYDRTPSPDLHRESPAYYSERVPEPSGQQDAFHSRSRSPQLRAASRSKSNPKLADDVHRGANSPQDDWQAGEEARSRLSVKPMMNDEFASRQSAGVFFPVPQLKFYENAIDQYNRKVRIEELVQEKIKHMANSKKMNDRSEMILKEKVEESLMAAYHEACPHEDSKLTFEKLGRVLYCMGAFSIIQYDEHAQLVNNFESLTKADRAQHFNEVAAANHPDDAARADLEPHGVHRRSDQGCS